MKTYFLIGSLASLLSFYADVVIEKIIDFYLINGLKTQLPIAWNNISLFQG